MSSHEILVAYAEAMRSASNAPAPDGYPTAIRKDVALALATSSAKWESLAQLTASALDLEESLPPELAERLERLESASQEVLAMDISPPSD
jgi:hypothetical protein